MALNFNRVPGPGETRACTDPWKFMIVRSTGDVSLCCRSAVVGNLKEEPLDTILASPEAVRMRERLLVGDLPQDCVVCSERGVTTLEGLRRDVEHVLFGEGLEELEDLRRQVYEHREVRSELLRQAEMMRRDIHDRSARLEQERVHLTAHVENLERELAQSLPRLFVKRLRGRLRL